MLFHNWSGERFDEWKQQCLGLAFEEYKEIYPMHPSRVWEHRKYLRRNYIPSPDVSEVPQDCVCVTLSLSGWYGCFFSQDLGALSWNPHSLIPLSSSVLLILGHGHQLLISFGASDLHVASGAPHSLLFIQYFAQTTWAGTSATGIYELSLPKALRMRLRVSAPCPSSLWCLGNCQLFLCTNAFVFVYDGRGRRQRVINREPVGLQGWMLAVSSRDWLSPWDRLSLMAEREELGWSRMVKGSRPPFLQLTRLSCWVKHLFGGFLSPVLFSFLKYIQTCLCSFRFQL